MSSATSHQPPATSHRSAVRICHCIDSLSACGAQQVVRQLVTHLDREQFQPFVYTFQDGPLAEPIEKAGITVRRFHRRIPRLDPFLVMQLRRLLVEDRIEIVHTHLFGATLHTFLASKGLGSLKRVISLHCDREDNLLQRVFYPLLFGASERIVGVSEHSSRHMKARFSSLNGKLSTIENGIDMKPFLKQGMNGDAGLRSMLPKGKKVIGAIGRLTTQKGFPILLEAVNLMRRDHSGWHLCIIGEGNQRNQLREQIEGSGLSDSVSLLGARNDIPELLSSMDVFVMSSLWEGLPMVLLEAMAAGVPIVATNVGGIPQVLTDGIEGLIVPPNDPESLAAAITRLLEDPETAHRFAQNARKKAVVNYSVQVMVERHQALYQEILSSETTSRFLAS